MPIVKTPVEAYFNHGRWVADCPDEDCEGAEIVERGKPFVCGSCHRRDWLNQKKGIPHNKDNENSVTFPTQANARTIERVLAARPINARNWKPGVTIAELKRENVEHGLPEEAIK